MGKKAADDAEEDEGKIPPDVSVSRVKNVTTFLPSSSRSLHVTNLTELDGEKCSLANLLSTWIFHFSLIVQGSVRKL